MPGKKGLRIARFVLTISIMLMFMVASLIGLYVYMNYLLSQEQREGFSFEDLVTPEYEERSMEAEERPTFISPGPIPSFSCKLQWPVNATTKMLDGYAGIGAVLNLTLQNTGTTNLYVERVMVSTGWGAGVEGEVGKFVYRDQERYLRHLLLPIPLEPPEEKQRSYVVSMDLLIDKPDLFLLDQWVRKENMEFDPSTVNIMELEPYTERPEVKHNHAYYYDKVHDLIGEDTQEISSLVANLSFGQGNYTIQKVADAFEWVVNRIEYIPDPDNGRNQWISPTECLARGGGDCEDYAILFGSLIHAMGGNARVVITEGHAFNAVYLGDSTDALSLVEERYGLDIPFQIWVDDLGTWLIVEPQSYLVFGWFPLDVEPTSGADDRMYLYGVDGLGWKFVETDTVYVVDIYFK